MPIEILVSCKNLWHQDFFLPFFLFDKESLLCKPLVASATTHFCGSPLETWNV
uniref:Uncharacterized protein n=1 Tax=Rhizophora mucronata TaxID=61149 RepID=A0A2P2PS09_RHIMU